MGMELTNVHEYCINRIYIISIQFCREKFCKVTFLAFDTLYFVQWLLHNSIPIIVKYKKSVKCVTLRGKINW